MNREVIDWVLLGSGGVQPTVKAMCPNTGRVRTLLSLPHGDSVYAIQRLHDQADLVVGTKSGAIKTYRIDPDSSDTPTLLPVNIGAQHQRAPILDVATLSSSRFAVANAWGGAFAFNLSGQNCAVTALDVHPYIVCALCGIGHSHIACLCTDGAVLICDPTTGSVEERVSACKPPPTCALVYLTYFSAANALVYPGEDGSLVVINLSDCSWDTLPAYSEPWYAATIAGDTLLTIGDKSGAAYLWDGSLHRTDIPLNVGAEVIQSSWINDTHTALMVIRRDGVAEVVHLAADYSCAKRSRLEGGDYRSLMAPDHQALTRYQRDQLRQQARQVADLAMEKLGRGADPKTEVESLVDIGYAHVAQAILLRKAKAEASVVDELAALHSLVRLLPLDAPQARRYACDYVERLVDAGLLDEACAAHLQAKEPSGLKAATQKLFQSMQESRKRDAVVICRPRNGIETSFLVASRLGLPMKGRWWIKDLRPLDCGSVHIPPKELVTQIAHANESWVREGWTVRYEHVIRAEAEQSYEAPSILMCEERHPGFELLFQFHDLDGHQVISPTVVFHIPGSQGSGSSSEPMHVAQRAYQLGRTSARTKSSLRAAVDGVTTMVRKFMAVTQVAPFHSWRTTR